MTPFEALFVALLSVAGHAHEVENWHDADRAADVGRAADACAYAARPVLQDAGWVARGRGLGLGFWSWGRS